MKFVITRTSAFKESPCPEAFKSEYIYVDRRLVDDPAKIEWYGGKTDWWYEEGVNHRVENDQICRDMGLRAEWVVEINSLKDLLDFKKKYGRLVIDETYDHKIEIPKIEIYDYYRE